MPIPKIIHQVWLQGKDEVPERFDEFRSSWTENHPDWTHILWDDERIRALLEERFPWFINTYDGYRHMIQRVDAARYFILYEYGGFSVDVDMRSIKKLDLLLAQYPTAHMIISKLPFTPSEGRLLRPILGTDEFYTNAVVGTSKGYYVWENVLSSLSLRRNHLSFSKLLNVMASTGPAFFSVVMQQYASIDSAIVVLHERFFESGFGFDRNRTFSEDAFAEHHQEASWQSGFLKFVFTRYFLIKNFFKQK